MTLVLLLIAIVAVAADEKKTEKPKAELPVPFSLYDHEMHNGLFEAGGVGCETCHVDERSYGDLRYLNRIGCHTCHNNPDATMPGPNTCTLCHGEGGAQPRNHRVAWLAQHQVFAKANGAECAQCHANVMFCVNCHQRRDTVQETAHRRNFRFFHSIEARANPRRCEACHTVTMCQACHAGRETSAK
ncbi:MAG: hypothetical protein HY696_08400 [Deltaproteobacteria bacterium]|nr:hypothetical protein [Deltaproteobacteria bacterium]